MYDLAVLASLHSIKIGRYFANPVAVLKAEIPT
jgi:hypothetical protein